MLEERMKEIELYAVIDEIPTLIAFVEEFSRSMDCPIEVIRQLNVAIDEIFSNIARYAYPDGIGKVQVSLECLESPRRIKLTFMDEGIRYNPMEKEDPDTTIVAEERQVGGLGIYIVKKSMDAMEYLYEDGKNILVIEKKY